MRLESLPPETSSADAPHGFWGSVPLWRRAARVIVDALSLPWNWFEEITQRTYRPRLTPLQHLRPAKSAEHQWESTGNDPQFRIEPPLPKGWVELRLKGSGSPAALAALYLSRDGGLTESDARLLGLLTPAGNGLELLVNLRGVRFARLDPSLCPGQFTIEDLSLQRVGVWRVALRAATLYLRRVSDEACGNS